MQSSNSDIQMKGSIEISDRVHDVPEALSIYINQLVYSEKRKGMDIITLSLGEAFFDIPQFSFENIDFVKGYHYSDSMGLPELREKIVDYYNTQYHAKIAGIKNVMISSGSKAIIYMTMLTILNCGDEVLIHEPAWLSYEQQARLVGAIPVFIPYNDDLNDLSHYVSAKTKLLILNNPNNPAGSIYSKERLFEVYHFCRENNIIMIMDEAYSDYTAEYEEFTSLASVADQLKGAIVINSLSKNMGMSGWRVGYCIAEESFLVQLLKCQEHIITCAPTILQMYLSRYFDDIIKTTIPQVHETVKKRQRVKKYIDDLGLKYLQGHSTFYIFVDLSGIKCSTLDFCLYILFKYGIAAVPGSAYGKSTSNFIRIGIGAESEERIQYALRLIKMVKECNLVNSEYIEKRLKASNYYRFEE